MKNHTAILSEIGRAPYQVLVYHIQILNLYVARQFQTSCDWQVLEMLSWASHSGFGNTAMP